MPEPFARSKSPTKARSTRTVGPRPIFADQPKTIYLIRHGESIAQTFTTEKRSQDSTLRDCGISETGEDQATVLPSILGLERYRQIDCVISSPLTRAVRTSVLGFPSKPIIINYDLMEIGRDKNPMPENQARPIMDVMADTGGESRIDEEYFAPTNKPFPESHQHSPSAIRKTKLPKVWEAIWEYCNRRKCQEIAVVCHFNVIRMSLDSRDVKPRNAIPIECHLYRDGTLEMVDVLNDEVQEMTATLLDLKKRNRWCMCGHDKQEELPDEENEAPENEAPENELIDCCEN